MPKLIFDNIYTSVILRQAIKENIIEVAGNPEIAGQFIASESFASPEITQAALWQIVINEDVYFNSIYDNIVIKNSIFNEALSGLGGINHHHVFEKLKVADKAGVDLMYRILTNTSEVFFGKEEFEELARNIADGQYEKNQEISRQVGCFRTYRDYQKAFRKMRYLELPNFKGRRMGSGSFRGELGRLAFCKAREEARYADAASEVLNFTMSNLIPFVAANLLDANIQTFIGEDSSAASIPRTAQRAGYEAALTLYFNNIRTVPTVRTIDEALSLREDKRIHDFREVLFNWANELKLNPSNASKIISDIEKSHKELMKFNRLSECNGVLQSVALSAECLSVISSLESLSLLPVNILSAVIELLISNEKKRYNWILFGT